jgi:predicted transcriptional regulator
MIALLSIKPVHAENIFSGRKKFEYRKKVFARADVQKIVVYCSKPVGAIIGEFDIQGILRDSPSRLWKKTHRDSGISEQYFYNYFNGCDVAFALKIGSVRRFPNEIDPQEVVFDFYPPQSFMYLTEGVHSSIVRSVRCHS